MRLEELQPAASAILSARLTPNRAAPVALALSGGGDSAALLGLASTWAATAGRSLLALTVDHRLHPDSARWTAAAGAMAAAAGAAWRPLAWEGPKPAAGLPAAARRARHRLIAEAAREAGASVVLFAHTADDIFEAQAMRAEGSTTPEPREWSPSPVWPEGRGIFLLRPLLGVRRALLRGWLRGRGEGWLEDPANTDLRYARARARRRLGAGAALREPAASIAVDPGLLPISRATEDGRLIVERSALGEAGGRFLARAVVCVAGGARPPRGRGVDRIVQRLAAGDRFAATLAGARIDADEHAVTFSRDAGERARGGLAGLALSEQESAVWDGRFAIRAEAPGAVVAAAGLMARLPRPDRAALKRLPAAARASLPAWIDPAGLVSLPRPFGAAPAEVRSLVGARLAGACGSIVRERDIGARTIEDGAQASCALS